MKQGLNQNMHICADLCRLFHIQHTVELSTVESRIGQQYSRDEVTMIMTNDKQRHVQCRFSNKIYHTKRTSFLFATRAFVWSLRLILGLESICIKGKWFK